MKKIKYFTRKYLENRPPFYAFIRPQEASLFYEHKKFIKPPLVDFGCGDGFFSQIVFKKKYIDVGLDLKESRIGQAKKIYKKLTIYNGVKIPYPNNCFRSVISNCVLEHIPNLKASLKEIYRILRPDGYFVATVMTNQWENYIFGKKLMRKIQQHYSLFTEDGWQKTFEKIGFKVERKVGYLSASSAYYNEIFHFLSIPNLISYKLYGKWVVCPKMLASPVIVNAISRKISSPVQTSKSAAIFFVLKKLV